VKLAEPGALFTWERRCYAVLLVENRRVVLERRRGEAPPDVLQEAAPVWVLEGSEVQRGVVTELREEHARWLRVDYYVERSELLASWLAAGGEMIRNQKEASNV
jgi:hypothetical protein